MREREVPCSQLQQALSLTGIPSPPMFANTHRDLLFSVLIKNTGSTSFSRWWFPPLFPVPKKFPATRCPPPPNRCPLPIWRNSALGSCLAASFPRGDSGFPPKPHPKLRKTPTGHHTWPGQHDLKFQKKRLLASRKKTAGRLLFGPRTRAEIADFEGPGTPVTGQQNGNYL